MSSPKYQGRHHAGRHRSSGTRARLSRAFTATSVLPAVAAAALVVSATGATVAESAPRQLEFSDQQTAMARTEQAVEEATASDLASRRRASAMQTAAVQGRVEARARAARTAQRRTAAAAAARAKAVRAKAERARAAKARAQREGRYWVKAIHSGVRTSGFGPRWGRAHDGLDVGAPTGTPLYAMSRGTVILSENGSGLGNKIEIRYWDGTVSWYGHLSRRDVRSGDTVMPGDTVGLVGDTGHSFGSHLHVEIHPHGGDRPIDPYPWLQARRILPG